MFSLKSDLTMTMVKDSLQKAYARDEQTASYNCGESVDDGIAETTDIDDPDNGEAEGLEEQGDDPSMESLGENVDSELSKLSEETDEEEPEEEISGELPLVDKEELEEQAEEILNRMINSHQTHNRGIESDSQMTNTNKRINRTTDVEIESSKTTRERIPNSILISN